MDDDETIRESLALALEQAGYEVIGAENGRAGLELLSRAPRPCLILLDLMMPVMNGWEFLEAVRATASLAEIPVVAVTAFGSRAKGIRVDQVLRKPVSLGALLGTVRRYCGQGGAPTPGA